MAVGIAATLGCKHEGSWNLVRPAASAAYSSRGDWYSCGAPRRVIDGESYAGFRGPACDFGPCELLRNREPVSDGPDSPVVRACAGFVRLFGDQSQREPPQTVHAHQCNDSPHRADWVRMARAEFVRGSPVPGSCAEPYCTGSTGCDGRPDADLRAGMHQVVCRRTAREGAVAYGDHARRWNGPGHQRGARGPWPRCEQRQGGFAETKAEPEKAVAADSWAGGPAQ